MHDVERAGRMLLDMDPLDEVVVPIQVLTGAQTRRAVEIFPISGRNPDHSVI